MKNCKTHSLGGSLTAVCLTLLGCLLGPGSALAQTAPKVAGELISSKGATLNGTAAISGLTVFSGSRIKVADSGSATVSVGKLGRFELGSSTDMVLSFSSNSVGGDLLGGRAVLSVPAGVNIAVQTAEGTITTDGAQPSVLSIDLTNQRARVVTYLGDAKITSAGKTVALGSGEETMIQRQASNKSWQRGRIMAAGAVGAAGAAGAIGAAGSAATAGKAATTAVTAASVTSQSLPRVVTLVNSSAKLSTVSITRPGLTRDPRNFFTPILTCRDRTSSTCRRRSFAGQ